MFPFSKKTKKIEKIEKKYNNFPFVDNNFFSISKKYDLNINGIRMKELLMLYNEVEPLNTGLNVISRAKEKLVPYIYNKNTQEYTQDRDIIRLLLHPKFNQNYSELIEQVSNYKKLTGNIFIILKSSGYNEKVEELEVVRPDMVTIDTYLKKILIPKKYTILFNNGETIDFILNSLTEPRYFTEDKKWELIHDNGINFSGDHYNYMGNSKIYSIYLQCEKFLKTMEHNVSLLDNGVNPGLLLLANSGDDGCSYMTDEQIQSIKKSLSNEYSGVKNSGKNIVLEGINKVEKITMTEKDMNFIDGAKFDRRSIFSNLGVPLAIVGEEQTTYNGYNDALMSLYNEIAMPEVQKFFNWIQCSIAVYRYNLSEDEVITYRDKDIEIVRESRIESNIKIIEALSKIGIDILTEDEKRHLLGFDKKEENNIKKIEYNYEDYMTKDEEKEKTEVIRILTKSGYDTKDIINIIKNYDKY